MCFDIGIVTCGPNEALVVSGMGYGEYVEIEDEEEDRYKPYIVMGGGRVIVCPCIQTIQRITLNTMTLEVHSPRVYTSQGVAISVTGIAQVKINGCHENMIWSAAEKFGNKGEEEVTRICLDTMEGHQRAIMGAMTVEEIYQDRKLFSAKVFEVSTVDLANMGINVISYTIKEVTDELGYLKSLGETRTYQVKRDARIGQAEAKMESTIAEAKAAERTMEAQLSNETQVAKAKRDYDMKKATYDTEVNTAEAEAKLAYQLQAAKVNSRIKEEDMQVKVVERQQEIAIQEQEIQRKEKELDSKVRRPAAMEKFRLETIAEAEKLRAVLEAKAEAEATAIKGDAEAFAIEERAKAEAEQMAKKADAWKEYKEAALVDMMLKVLPSVASEIATPLSNAKTITMVSTGDGPVGASKMTDEVLSIMSSLPSMVRDMTGVDIREKLSILPGEEGA